MASMQQFLGFKRVSQSVFNSVRPEKKELYMWFVKPDGDLVNETGDIYLGSYHYGHYGHADADNIQELWDTLGSMFESGSSVTVTDVIEEIQGTYFPREERFIFISPEGKILAKCRPDKLNEELKKNFPFIVE